MREAGYGIANSEMNRHRKDCTKPPLARSHLLLNPAGALRLQR